MGKLSWLHRSQVKLRLGCGPYQQTSYVHFCTNTNKTDYMQLVYVLFGINLCVCFLVRETWDSYMYL